MFSYNLQIKSECVHTEVYDDAIREWYVRKNRVNEEL